MTSKEELERLEVEIAVNCVTDEETEVVLVSTELLNQVLQDLERLEELEKVIEFLNKVFKFELGVSVVNGEYHYSLEYLLDNPYTPISKKLYDLLKGVFGNE